MGKLTKEATIQILETSRRSYEDYRRAFNNQDQKGTNYIMATLLILGLSFFWQEKMLIGSFKFLYFCINWIYIAAMFFGFYAIRTKIHWLIGKGEDLISYTEKQCSDDEIEQLKYHISQFDILCDSSQKELSQKAFYLKLCLAFLLLGTFLLGVGFSHYLFR